MIVRRSRFLLLLISSLINIIIVTLYPFDFASLSFLAGLDIINSFQQTTHIKDYIRNVLLFIPWGIGIAGVIQINHRQESAGQIISLGCFWSIVLSSVIEFMQLLLPSRVSSYSDILSNTLGGIIGVILYREYVNLIQLIKLIVQGKYQQINLRFLAKIMLFYSIAIAWGWLLLLNNLNFNNWNEAAYLALASEVTGQLDWQGNIHSLYICDRQLLPEEIPTAFEQSDRFFAQLPNLVTALVLFPPQPFYQDASQNVPELFWTTELPPYPDFTLLKPDKLNLPPHYKAIIESHHPPLFKDNDSLISSYPATQLTQKLKKSQAFSLSIILKSDRPKQVGPARIMSLGENIYSRNLMLAQQNTKLFFRLRTPTTRNNATQPGFYLPNFFKDGQLHHLIVTFSDRQLNFYVDCLENHYHFSFEPATHLQLYLPWKIQAWEINLQEYNLLRARLIFYSLILLPMVIFGSILLLRLLPQFSAK